jgi:hypothetical protein
MRAMMARLRLTINEAKTHICRIPKESFDFLGYTFGRCYAPVSGRPYIGTRPSQRKIKFLCDTIHELTSRRWLWREPKEQVKRLNQVISGWANYFCLGAASKAYRSVMRHARKRLRQWLCKKHQMHSRRYVRFSDDWMHQELGLVNLDKHKRNFS